MPRAPFQSFGHTAHNADSFDVKFQQQSAAYLLPPAVNYYPPPPTGLDSLPNVGPFNNQNSASLHNQWPQALPPLIHNSVRLTGGDCRNGPNLGGNGNNIPAALQSSYGVPNVVLDVSQSGYETAQTNIRSNVATSYDAPASGDISLQNPPNIHEMHEPSSSYGPPPSGNPADSFGFESELKSASLAAESAKQEVSNAEEANVSQLPGLDGAGLDIVSAKQSHSLEIPVQGALGSYSLQFQAIAPLESESSSNELNTPDHQKVLSDGLLESILTAIEQPQSNSFVAPQTHSEPIENHRDVVRFVHSRVGQETLSEPEPTNRLRKSDESPV